MKHKLIKILSIAFVVLFFVICAGCVSTEQKTNPSVTQATAVPTYYLELLSGNSYSAELDDDGTIMSLTVFDDSLNFEIEISKDIDVLFSEIGYTTDDNYDPYISIIRYGFRWEKWDEPNKYDMIAIRRNIQYYDVEGYSSPNNDRWYYHDFTVPEKTGEEVVPYYWGVLTIINESKIELSYNDFNGKSYKTILDKM